MNVTLQSIGNQFKNEGLPAVINTVGTGALTYLGAQAPKAVEFLNFNMSMEALAGGSVFVSAAGSLMNVLGNTFAADTYKKPMIQAAAYAFAAFGSAYFLPQVATMAGLEVAFENAMALALASTLVNAARVFMPEKKPAEKDNSDVAALKKLDEKAFAALADAINKGTKELTNKDAKQYLTDRVEVSKTHKWDEAIAAKHTKDGKLNQEEYKKEATKLPDAA